MPTERWQECRPHETLDLVTFEGGRGYPALYPDDLAEFDADFVPVDDHDTGGQLGRMGFVKAAAPLKCDVADGFDFPLAVACNQANRLFRRSIAYLTDPPARAMQYRAWNYEPGTGNAWHDDLQVNNDGRHRVLSALMMVSPPGGFTGGRLQFRTPELGVVDVDFDQGTVLVFDPAIEHQVTRVISGRRIVCAGFYLNA